MTISRRIFCSAAFAPLATPAFAENSETPARCISSQAPSQSGGRVRTASEAWQKNQFIPPGLSAPNVFWGYSARPTIDLDLLPSFMQASAWSMYTVAENDKLMAVIKATETPYCDDPKKVRRSFNIGYPEPAQDALAWDLMSGLSTVPAALRKLPEEERFLTILHNLATIFRATEYEMRAPDSLATPKTLFSLAADQIGDCKDFALARLMAARFMGVKPEHAMIVLYLDGNRAGTIAHANMAIYNQKYGWVVVDGVGRDSATEELGRVFMYQNDQRVMKQLAGSYYGSMVPIAYVTAKGVGQFDSLWSFSTKSGMPNFKPAQPIPQRTSQFMAETYKAEPRQPASPSPASPAP